VAGLTRPVLLRTRLLQASQITLSHVSVMSEALPMPAYRDLIASAAIIVLPLHPSNYAGGVTVLVQAMAAGKAVIVSDSPGISEYVEHGESALVVPCHDAAALAEAIELLLRDHDLRRRLAAGARLRAEQKFSLQAWADRIEALAGSAGGGAVVKGAVYTGGRKA